MNKLTLYFHKKFQALLCVVVAACMLVFVNSLEAQINEPKRIKIGGSAGFGGVHGFGKFSFDVHWRGLSLRVAPGLAYIGVGITQRLPIYLNYRVRRDRPFIVSFYYHDDYFLSSTFRFLQKNPIRRDLDIYMVMAGIYAKLDRLGRVYCEAQAGLMYVTEKFNQVEGKTLPFKHHFFPMLEFRVGGIIQFHKNHKQKNPKGGGFDTIIRRR